MSDSAELAGEAAGAAVEQSVAQIADAAEGAIENAVARADAAEDLAQQITDAALQSELGRMVTSALEEIRQWREETHGRMESILSQTGERFNSLEMALTELQGRIPAQVIVTEAPESSTLEPQSDPLISPESAVDGPRESLEAESPRALARPRRLLL